MEKRENDSYVDRQHTVFQELTEKGPTAIQQISDKSQTVLTKPDERSIDMAKDLSDEINTLHVQISRVTCYLQDDQKANEKDVFHRRASSESYIVPQKRRNIFHDLPLRRTQSEPSLLEKRDKSENVSRQTMQERELFQKEEIEDTGTIQQQLLKEMDPLRYQRQDNKHATKDESNVVRLQTTYESSTFLKQQTSNEEVFLSQQPTSEFDIVPQPSTDESDNIQNIIDESDNIQLSGDESEITSSYLPGNESKNTSSQFSEHERVNTSSHQMDTKDVIFQGPTPKGSKNATSEKRITKHTTTPSDTNKTFQSEKFPLKSSSRYFIEPAGSGTETEEQKRHVFKHLEIDESSTSDTVKPPADKEIAEGFQAGIEGKISEDVIDDEVDIGRLKKNLLKIYNARNKHIYVSPLLERGNRSFPLELLYTSMVIHEDPKFSKHRDKKKKHETKVTTEKSSRTGKESFWTKTEASGIYTKVSSCADINPPHQFGSDQYDQEPHASRFATSYRQSASKQDTTDLTNPEAIFEDDGETFKMIYLLGDAAHGKTTFCNWLVRCWCLADEPDFDESEESKEWVKALGRFDFVFTVAFRNVNPNTASVTDMICQDLFADDDDYWDTINQILSSDKYRSLIIMDGLDEWSPNKETKKLLTCQGMPNMEGISSTVSCFFSMRPWAFSVISKVVTRDDRVIEILGLSDTVIDNVVSNVLLNVYGLKSNMPKYTITYNKIVKNLKENNLKSLMKIPFFADVCVQIWYEGKLVGDSMTSFYAEMLNMLIERASKKHELESRTEHFTFILPEMLSEYVYMTDCINVLRKLGKVAYEGLISNETNLVFRKRNLEKEIGVREFQFALDVGFISQREAPSLLTKNVSVQFFNKSMQEFLTVMYIVTNKEVEESFCKHLKNVKVIMELSNVIMFICGMCPSLGSVISQRVASVTDSSTEICRYRESPGLNSTVKELYKIQVSWYREIRNRQTNSRVTFYISDLYLDYNVDIETVRVTKELLTDHHVDIRSLFLRQLPNVGECGISNEELNDFLCNKHNNIRSLVMVFINGGINGIERCVSPLCIPSLKYLHLWNVKISGTYLDGDVCPPLLTHMTSLHVLTLTNMTLGDRGLDLTEIKSLRELRLDCVILDERGLNLSDLTLLQEIHLSNMTLGDRGLHLSNMTSLHELRLENVTMVDRGLDLSNMTSLHELRLENVTMGHRGLNLTEMKSLRKLRLDCVILDERGLNLSDLTLLQEIHLSNMTLGDRGLHLSNMTSLHELRLENVTFGDRGLGLFGVKSIQTLHLSKMNLGDRGVHLFDMISLHELRMEDVTLGDRGLDLFDMTSIQNLHLSNMTLEDKGLHLSDMISLHELRLEDVTLGDRGPSRFSLSSIQKLHLSNMTLEDRGLYLYDITSLHELRLENVTFGDRGLVLFGMKSIQKLHMSNMTLGDRGLHLSNMTSLHELRLEDVTLGDRGLHLFDMTAIQKLHLSNVTLGHRGLNLSNMTSLHVLRLENMTLGDIGLDLSANMVNIDEVILRSVDMSESQWNMFIMSVLDIQHMFDIVLCYTNIDDKSIEKFSYSENVRITIM